MCPSLCISDRFPRLARASRTGAPVGLRAASDCERAKHKTRAVKETVKDPPGRAESPCFPWMHPFRCVFLALWLYRCCYTVSEFVSFVKSRSPSQVPDAPALGRVPAAPLHLRPLRRLRAHRHRDAPGVHILCPRERPLSSRASMCSRAPPDLTTSDGASKEAHVMFLLVSRVCKSHPKEARVSNPHRHAPGVHAGPRADPGRGLPQGIMGAASQPAGAHGTSRRPRESSPRTSRLKLPSRVDLSAPSLPPSPLFISKAHRSGWTSPR